MLFYCDYMRGCHPEILARMVDTNMDATPGYGADEYSARGRRVVAEACGLDPERCLVEFLVGGTQTNATVIDAMLRSFQGVMAAESAHISVHEAGAIEAGGHKVIVLPSEDGKLRAEDVARYVDDFYADETYPHMVAPAMVYISHPTEVGTLYSLAELEALSDVCRRRGVKLYMDGARLAYGLKAEGTDVGLEDIARLCDVFYIGGTKCGAMFGEAVVARDKGELPNFFTVVKQHGALLAKGRLTGIEFETLFSNDLYGRIGEHGIKCAKELRRIFSDAGVELFIDSPTNQQFFMMPADMICYLREAGVGFELWGPMRPGLTPVRFVTDWSTEEESLRKLSAILDRYTKGK